MRQLLALQRAVGNTATTRLVLQRTTGATAAAATVEEDPTCEHQERLITKKSTLYRAAGSRNGKVPNTTKLRPNDVAITQASPITVREGLLSPTDRSYVNVKVFKQGGETVEGRNISGFIKTDHTAAFFRHQMQTGIPLLEKGIAPSPDHIRQGGLGDCYLLAALMTTAAQEPQSVVSMFDPSPYEKDAQEHAVRFYDARKDHKTDMVVPTGERWVRVRKSVLVAGASAGRYTAGERVLERGSQLWPAIVEKAYAAWKGGKKGYKALETTTLILNNVSLVLAQLSGKPQRMEGTDIPPESRYRHQASNDERRRQGLPPETLEEYEARLGRELAIRLISILRRGGPIFAGMGDEIKLRQSQQAAAMGIKDDEKGPAGEVKSGGLASGHAYEVIGLEKDGNILYVKVRNPWGKYGRTKYLERAYRVEKDEKGAVSYVEIRDFLDAFGTIHHSLTSEQVTEATEALETSGFLHGVEITLPRDRSWD